MPVIIVGADTPVGEAVVNTVSRSAAEVRAFISDARRVDGLKKRGVKVALGDISDFSHVEAAGLYCFCAVLVIEAAVDGRERAFASGRRQVLEGWAEAVGNAGIRRAIWVGGEDALAGLPPSAPEAAAVTVGSDGEAAVKRAVIEVARLESAARLPD